jgi:hypothetical protein
MVGHYANPGITRVSTVAAFCSVVLSDILTTIGHIGIEVATSMSAPGTEETKRIALEWAHEYLSHTISYLALADL